MSINASINPGSDVALGTTADAATGLGGAAAGAAGEAAATGAAGTAVGADATMATGAALGTGAITGATATAGAGVVTAGAATAVSAAFGCAAPEATVVDAAPMLPRSLIFFANSALRLAASWASFSCAILSSAALACNAPLESVSLSGALTAAFLSSTLVWMLPTALRSAAATGTLGALAANLPRKSLKSRLCAITVCDASAAPMAVACSWLGMLSTAPARRRFRLPLVNASAFARNSATSIWSSDTCAGLTAAAILLAVSPG